MVRVILLLSALAAAGCPRTMDFYGRPVDQRYDRLEWATTSVHEAEAQCHMEIQRTPTLGMPTCMRAKGWKERW